jgi:hypothetical protein
LVKRGTRVRRCGSKWGVRQRKRRRTDRWMYPSLIQVVGGGGRVVVVGGAFVDAEGKA